MADPLLHQRDLDCLLYELFDAESPAWRGRYADHKRKTFDAALATLKTGAEKYFLPYRQRVASHQLSLDSHKVHMIHGMKVALDTMVLARHWRRNRASWLKTVTGAYSKPCGISSLETRPCAKLLPALNDSTCDMQVGWF